MIISAAAEHHHFLPWLLLLVASAGVMEHSGIKIPFFAFFGPHECKRPAREAPWNMLLAMAVASAFCIGLGIGYPWLYSLLPFESHYSPYTAGHVVTQMQLLLFAALAFVVLMKLRVYPEEIRAINLDTDWTYRRLLPVVIRETGRVIWVLDRGCRNIALRVLESLFDGFRSAFNQRGLFGGSWSTATMAVWATLLLGLCLLLYYM